MKATPHLDVWISDIPCGSEAADRVMLNLLHSLSPNGRANIGRGSYE